MPTQLPTIRHKDIDYYIDIGLREFRPVDRPFESVPFDSDLGREMEEQLDDET